MFPLLPLFSSWYSIQALVYFGTDLIGLAFLILFIAAMRAPTPHVMGGAASASALVFVRHMYAPILVAPLIQGLLTKPFPNIGKFAVITAGAAIVPVAILALYISHWGGLTPPGLATELNKSGVFPQAWIHALAYLAIAAVIFWPPGVATHPSVCPQ